MQKCVYTSLLDKPYSTNTWNDEEYRPEPSNDNYDVLYRARPVLDLINAYYLMNLHSMRPHMVS